MAGKTEHHIVRDMMKLALPAFPYGGRVGGSSVKKKKAVDPLIPNTSSPVNLSHWVNNTMPVYRSLYVTLLMETHLYTRIRK